VPVGTHTLNVNGSRSLPKALLGEMLEQQSMHIQHGWQVSVSEFSIHQAQETESILQVRNQKCHLQSSKLFLKTTNLKMQHKSRICNIYSNVKKNTHPEPHQPPYSHHNAAVKIFSPTISGKHRRQLCALKSLCPQLPCLIHQSK
jgi:hypothetical protein